MDAHDVDDAPEPPIDAPSDEGGDAPCWAHLLEDLRGGTGPTGPELANDAE